MYNVTIHQGSQPLPSEEKVADLDGRETVPGDLSEGVDLPENDAVAPHVMDTLMLSVIANVSTPGLALLGIAK